MLEAQVSAAGCLSALTRCRCAYRYSLTVSTDEPGPFFSHRIQVVCCLIPAVSHCASPRSASASPSLWRPNFNHAQGFPLSSSVNSLCSPKRSILYHPCLTRNAGRQCEAGGAKAGGGVAAFKRHWGHHLGCTATLKTRWRCGRPRARCADWVSASGPERGWFGVRATELVRGRSGARRRRKGQRGSPGHTGRSGLQK